MAIWIAQLDNQILIAPVACVAHGVAPIDAAVALGWNEPGVFVPEHIDPITGEIIPDHTEAPIYNGKWREITDQERIALQEPSPAEKMKAEYMEKREAIRKKYDQFDGTSEGILRTLNTAHTSAVILKRDPEEIEAIEQQYAQAHAAMTAEIDALNLEYGVTYGN